MTNETLNETSWEHAREAAFTFVQGVQLNFRRHGHVRAVSLFLARRDLQTGQVLPEPQLVLAPLNELMCDKREARALQQHVVDRTNAAWHVFVSECWMVELEPSSLYEDCSVRPAEHPRRVEQILVQLEHESGRSTAWRLSITRDAEGRGTVGDPVEDDDATQSTGTFTGYFRATRHTEVEA